MATITINLDNESDLQTIKEADELVKKIYYNGENITLDNLFNLIDDLIDKIKDQKIRILELENSEEEDNF